MAKELRGHDEEAWRNAKKICQLNARQIEMARALGMNPKKLPSLRPGPHQRWKLPVGEFIEECYRKRFGGDPHGHHAHNAEPGSQKPPAAQQHMPAQERIRDAAGQLGDLVCYLMNLVDDLQAWLTEGTEAGVLLRTVTEELRAIAEALESGRPIWPFPAITPPSGPTRRAFSRQGDEERPFDDEIPF